MPNSINILKPSVCFEVQRIIGITASDGKCKSYQVQWAPSWISGIHLIGCEDLIEQFEFEENKKKGVIKIEIVDVENSSDRDTLFHEDKSNDEVPASDKLPEMQLVENLPQRDAITNCGESRPYSHNPLRLRLHSTSISATSLDENMENSGQDNAQNYITDTNSNLDFQCAEKNIEHVYKSRVLQDEHNMSLFHSHRPSMIENQKASRECIDVNSVGATFVISQTTDHSHAEVWQPPSIAVLTCDKASEDTDLNLNEINEKILGTNGEFEKTFDCNICNGTFTSDGSMRSACHCNTYDAEVETYQCKVCHRKYRSKFYLQKHELIHSSGRCFSCNLCQKIFTNNEKLQVHIQRHTEGRFQCTVCSKVFLTRTKLKTHIRVHTGERPFECKVCGKRFKIDQHLQRHLEKLHPEDRHLMYSNV